MGGSSLTVPICAQKYRWRLISSSSSSVLRSIFRLPFMGSLGRSLRAALISRPQPAGRSGRCCHKRPPAQHAGGPSVGNPRDINNSSEPKDISHRNTPCKQTRALEAWTPCLQSRETLGIGFEIRPDRILIDPQRPTDSIGADSALLHEALDRFNADVQRRRSLRN